jgi:hypothetical protein
MQINVIPKTYGKRSCEIPKSKWDSNIKSYRKETQQREVDWIVLRQGPPKSSSEDRNKSYGFM